MEKVTKMHRFVSRVALWLPLALWLVGQPTAVSAADDLTALKGDFPLLTKRYGSRLESRTAHYIFAIDVSNSMRQYEQTVRTSLVNFVNAVPDGDQISIIIMADRQQTDFLDNIQCVKLNGEVRRAITEALRSPRFNFTKDGSDGYTMAARVLEAMNSVGSSDLTFVYMLTDFEYWTSEHGYNKRANDWAALRNQLSDKHVGSMCKYGIELNFDKVRHPEAICKPELEGVFGKIEYRPTSSATLLAEWFAHIIDNIRANKINAMLRADWAALLDSSRVQARTAETGLMLRLDMPASDLVEGYHVQAAGGDGFEALPAVEGTLGKRVGVGRYRLERNWWPGFAPVGGDEAALKITYDSPYGKEISRLQDLCVGRDGERLELTEVRRVEVPTKWVWSSSVPLPLWALIILVLGAIVASLVYTLTQRFDKRLSFTVYHKAGSDNMPYTGDTRRFPFTIADGGDLDVPGAAWKVRLSVRRGLLLLFGLKGGYYLTLADGQRATLYNNRNDKVQATLRRGQKVLLFGRKAKKPLRLEIDEADMGSVSTIEIN